MRKGEGRQILKNCKTLAKSNEEVEKIKKEFIKNFKKEYEIIEK